MPLDSQTPFIVNLRRNNTIVTLAVTGAVGQALSSTEAITAVTITTPSACTIRGRYKNVANGPAVKGVDSFPITIVVSASGAYDVRDGSNVGGSLTPGVTYRSYWYLTSDDDPTGTAVVQSNEFTMPTAGSDVAPSNIRWSGGGTSISVSESAAVGSIVGTIIADGSPTPQIAEVSDPDGKFTVASNGQVTLAAALDFGTAGSHSLTVSATNTAGAPTQVMTINVTEAPSGGGGGIDETADYVVASPNAFLTLVEGWTLSGGVRQVPQGRAVLVQFTGSQSGDFVMPHKFSHLVTLRGIGPYTMGYSGGLLTGGCGAEITGRTHLDGAAKFRLALTKLNLIDGGLDNEGALRVNDTTDVTLEQVWIRGTPFNVTTPGDTSAGVRWLVQPGVSSGNTRLTFRYCHFSYAFEAMFNLKSNHTDFLMEFCTFDHQRHDCIKWTGVNNVRPVMRDTWFCRTTVVRLSTKHTDMLQTQSGEYADAIIEYCVGMYGKRQNGNDSSYQGLFCEGTSIWTRPTMRHVCIVSNHTNALVCQTRVGTSLLQNYAGIRYRMGAAGSSQGYSIPRVVSWASGELSLGFMTSRSSSTLTADQGANGDGLDIGDTPSPNFSLYTVEDFSGVPNDAEGFEVMLPPSTASRRHWNTTDPLGPTGDAFLLKRVFADKIHPGDRWPTAEPWHRQYNFKKLVPVPIGYTGTFSFAADGTVATSTTASYDANGMCVAA